MRLSIPDPTCLADHAFEQGNKLGEYFYVFIAHTSSTTNANEANRAKGPCCGPILRSHLTS